MTTTNIKNLPTDNNEKYFTELMYSDRHAYVVVDQSASGRTLTIARIEVKPDPEWKEKMEFYPGGFCGHVANQNQQTWLFDRVNTDNIRKVRKNKKGQWACRGVRFAEDQATEFYDYNF